MTITAFLPSPEQAEVIAHRGGHLQVIACAGAGKTEAISRRVAALIEEGVEPSQIVAFTFTARAVMDSSHQSPGGPGDDERQSPLQTNGSRRYGCSPVCTRLVTPAPRGPRGSTSFIAGLQADGLIAAWWWTARSAGSCSRRTYVASSSRS